MKPIIFTAKSVRAILDGHKTQTRRVVRFSNNSNPNWTGYVPDGNIIYGSNNIPVAKAYYKIGDIVYVKETWCTDDNMSDVFEESLTHGFYYKADVLDMDWVNDKEVVRWHSPLFMPKEAARLFLRVKGVRAERLHDIVKHDIDVGDIRSEGIFEPCLICEMLPGHYNGSCRNIMGKNKCGMINAYAKLWDSINKKHGHGWNTNPWVWVYTFERTERGKE